MIFRSLLPILILSSLMAFPSKLSATSTGLDYNLHMSDCENQWVVLSHEASDKPYTYGFVYIDPEAGFTLQIAGSFMIDAGGKYRAEPNPLASDKYNVKIRLQDQNGVAALLPPEAKSQLGLPDKPEWLKFYDDNADPVTHAVKWGSFYNEIGDSQRAVRYLESAYKQQPDAPKVVFELAYAYNALGRPQDAIRVSQGGFAKNPEDELVCRELAFAYLSQKSYEQASQQFHACVSLCGDSESGMAEKSELAMNLSATYARLGDSPKSAEWVEKAKTWAPKGSPVYKHFHPDEE